jgi:cell division protein FtsZ
VERPAAECEESRVAGVDGSKPSFERQETLQLEPVSRGRFEKSEPTIIDGEDLDVPTFLRRNVRIK